MPLCSASHVPGVPGESSEWQSGSKASVISAEPRSLIPGLIILHTVKPQLRLCSPLILSICVWDHGGSPVSLPCSLSITLSISTSASISRVEAKIKMSPVFELSIRVLGKYLNSFFAQERHARVQKLKFLGKMVLSRLYLMLYMWTNSIRETVIDNNKNTLRTPKIPWLWIKFQSIIEPIVHKPKQLCSTLVEAITGY